MGEYETLDVGGRAVRLYLAGDVTPGAPGVVVLHAWWGLNDDVIAYADRLAAAGFAVVAPDMFGGVSTKAHSTPSARAWATVSLMPRMPLRSCGSAVPRSLCQSEIEPCGSASISMQRRDGRFACAARWAVSVLLPEPPLREAKTMTFMRAALIRVIWLNLA